MSCFSGNWKFHSKTFLLRTNFITKKAQTQTFAFSTKIGGTHGPNPKAPIFRDRQSLWFGTRATLNASVLRTARWVCPWAGLSPCPLPRDGRTDDRGFTDGEDDCDLEAPFPCRMTCADNYTFIHHMVQGPLTPVPFQHPTSSSLSLKPLNDMGSLYTYVLCRTKDKRPPYTISKTYIK